MAAPGIDWTIDIKTILLTVVAILQCVFVFGKSFGQFLTKSDDNVLVTQKDIARLELDLSRAKDSHASAVRDLQRVMSQQHRAIAMLYVTNAEFRMFVDGHKSFREEMNARFDMLVELIGSERNGNES